MVNSQIYRLAFFRLSAGAFASNLGVGGCGVICNVDSAVIALLKCIVVDDGCFDSCCCGGAATGFGEKYDVLNVAVGEPGCERKGRGSGMDLRCSVGGVARGVSGREVEDAAARTSRKSSSSYDVTGEERPERASSEEDSSVGSGCCGGRCWSDFDAAGCAGAVKAGTCVGSYQDRVGRWVFRRAGIGRAGVGAGTTPSRPPPLTLPLGTPWLLPGRFHISARA